MFCAERKILPKPKRGRPDPNKQKRPRSRTLTAVYDNILDDLVFPAEIVGKRIRHKLDGSQLIKVHLDKNQQTTIEHKVSFNIQIVVTNYNLPQHSVLMSSCYLLIFFNMLTSVKQDIHQLLRKHNFQEITDLREYPFFSNIQILNSYRQS